MARRGRHRVEALAAKGDVTTMAEFLSVCPAEVRAEFLESQRFVHGKLAGARISGLRKCMSDAEIDSVFNHQGVRSMEILKFYRCASKGTCHKSQDDACTGNCMQD